MNLVTTGGNRAGDGVTSPQPRRVLRSSAVKAMAGRLSWGLGDQAVSSLVSLAVGLYVAHELGTTAFGIFTLAWVTYGVILNVSRGLATDPLMVRFSGVATDSWRPAAGHATGTAVAVGAVSGSLSLVAGLAIGGHLGAAFVALGVVVPLVLLQDAWRFAFFTVGLGKHAFISEVVWAVALIPAMLIAAHLGTVVAFVLGWGLASGVAAVYSCLTAGVLPQLRGSLDWMRRHGDLGKRYMIENVSNSGASQLRMYGLGAIAGLASVGAVRGAELLLGPFLALLMGLSLVTVAEGARVLRRDPHRLLPFCAVLGAGQAAAALAWGMVLLIGLPDEVGHALLGTVWDSASALILPVTLSVAGAGFASGAAAGLRALGAAKRSLRVQLISSGCYFGFGVTGAVVAGAPGSAWGTATAVLGGSVLWWLQLRAGLRDYLNEHEEMKTS